MGLATRTLGSSATLPLTRGTKENFDHSTSTSSIKLTLATPVPLYLQGALVTSKAPVGGGSSSSPRNSSGDKLEIESSTELNVKSGL